MKPFFALFGKAGRPNVLASTGPGGATRKVRRGFMLITVILIIAFITLLLISFSVLIRLETLSSANGKLLHQARQNSLVGLQTALGELQKHAGPDQRVTATASILDTSADTPEIDGIIQPYWTGVWNPTRYNASGKNSPWDPSSGSAPSYYSDSPGKRQGFGRWMVSLKDDTTAESIDAVKSFDPAAEDSVLMVGAGTLIKPGSAASLAPELSKVYVSKLEFDGAVPALKNHYAWWVGDEGVKARINRVDPNRLAGASPITGSQIAALNAAPRAALEMLEGFADLDSTTVQGQEGIIKVANRGSMSLGFKSSGAALTPEQFSGEFHDLTLFSEGVMSDTKNGGLRQDLNAIGEYVAAVPPDLPPQMSPDFAGKKMWTKDGTQGPEWDVFYNYYRRYKRVRMEGGRPVYVNNDNEKGFTGANLGTKNYEFYKDPVRDFVFPITTKIQYVFSIYSRDAYVDDGGDIRPPGTPPSGSMDVRIIAQPIFTIWNPYNIAISTEAIGWHFYKPPLEVQFYKNNVPQGWVSMKDLFAIPVDPGYFGGEWNPPDKQWFLRPLQNCTTRSPLTMGPGETRVLSFKKGPASTTQRYPANGNVAYDPGWTTPDGGVYSTNLIPLSNPAANTSTNPGRRLFAKRAANGVPSDRIGVEVRALAHDNLAPKTDGDPFERDMTFATDMVIPPVGSWSTEYYGSIVWRLTQSQLAKLLPPLTKGNLPDYSVDEIYSQPNKLPIFAVNITLRNIARTMSGSKKSKFGLFGDMTGHSIHVENVTPETLAFSQYDISIEPPPIFGNWSNLVQVNNEDNSGYVMTYDGARDPITGINGISRAALKEIPLQPLLSLGQLQHASLGRDYNRPMSDLPNTNPRSHNYNKKAAPIGAVANYALGNSFAHPMIPANKLTQDYSDASNVTAIDPFFYANEGLWDGFFFSSLAPKPAAVYGTAAAKTTMAAVYDDFTKELDPVALPNPNIRFRLPDGKTKAQVKSDLFDGAGNVKADACKKIAQYLLVDGAFNVNSTSVDAWTAMLAGRRNAKMPLYPSSGGMSAALQGTNKTPIARYVPTNAGSADAPSAAENLFWQGFRELNDTQIADLAKYLVEQVKKRGPFMSLGEFVNRQISSDSDLNSAGAVQVALDKLQLNGRFDGFQVTEGADFKNQEAAKGPMGAGAPGYITQADILTPIAPSLSARSDTFTVRAYGDVTRSGKLLARAWCEAVVQRLPEYVDSTNAPEILPSDPALTAINKNFGRKFRVISFRWLNEEDI